MLMVSLEKSQNVNSPTVMEERMSSFFSSAAIATKGIEGLLYYIGHNSDAYLWNLLDTPV